jgi:glutamate synthase domain-containing protein 2
MSKMGISTYQSYCGAQIFDAVGLKSDFVDKYFTGTATTIEGVGLAEIAEETVRRHKTPSATIRSARGRARCRRRIRLPHARRGACLDAGDGGATCSTPCAATRRTSTASSRAS